MKFLNRAMVIAFILCLSMASFGQSLNASSSGLLDGFTAYPTPNNKPYVCHEQEELTDETYLNKKQAAAAALGLYFGVKHANAPQLGKESKIKYLCV